MTRGPSRAVWSSRPPPPEGAQKVERLFVIPVFNDWDTVALLLPRIDAVLAREGLEADVLLVDDGSTTSPDAFRCPSASALRTVDVLRLRRNLGHQRAIAIALAWAEQRIDPAIVIVMDGDGEDDPAELPKMFAKLEETKRSLVVFAERKRRSEPILFRVFYQLYRAGHLLLTGYRVKVGNFSVVPRRALARLVVISETWNHYAAAVFNARIGYTTVPTTRAKRLGGESKMSFISLVVHGLSALSVYAHIIGVRVFIATGAIVVLTVFVLLCIGAAQAAGLGPTPTWLLYAAAGTLVILAQVVAASILFVFSMLASRQGASFIPLRDHTYFVDCLTRARGAGAREERPE